MCVDIFHVLDNFLRELILVAFSSFLNLDCRLENDEEELEISGSWFNGVHLATIKTPWVIAKINNA